MTKFAINAIKLRKSYKIYNRMLDTLLELLLHKPRHTEKIVLKDINFKIKQGEIVGILGRNGAGKSTLLKLIAGTLSKTSGSLEVRGKITAILELGTGFHPEYTGRENIYMGCFCLGMTKKEIDEKLESIIDFSELREVIDRPFKTYSSGMQARLTFSTAISVDPEILIVDEALSVGDAAFQMKCFAWMQNLREQKRTVILVSHDINSITALCDRAIILEQGTVYADGDTRTVTTQYHQLMFANENKENIDITIPANNITTPLEYDYTARYGSKVAELLSWGITDHLGKQNRTISSGTKCTFFMNLKCLQDVENISLGLAIKNYRGTVLWGITNISQNLPAYDGKKDEIITVFIECTMWLAAGEYFVNLGAAHLEDGNKIDFVDDGIKFNVVGPTGIFTSSLVNLDSKFQITSNLTN